MISTPAERKARADATLKKLSVHTTQLMIQCQEDMAAPVANAAINFEDEITFEELERAPMKLEDLKAEVQDPLLEVDLGMDGISKPTYISQLLGEEDKASLVALLKEYRDCFAWDFSEMPDLKRELVEHRLPIKKGFNFFNIIYSLKL